MKLLGPNAKREMGPPTYLFLFTILVFSYMAEGLLGPLRLQGQVATATSASPIATPLHGWRQLIVKQTWHVVFYRIIALASKLRTNSLKS